MSVKNKLISLVLLSALILSLSACAVRIDPPREISSVEEATLMGFEAVEYNEKIKAGSYQYLDVKIKLDFEDEVVWSSDNPEIATVDSGGRVDAIKEGKAVITAHAKSASVDYEIEVIKADKTTTSYTTAITANGDYLSLNKSRADEKNLYAIIVNEADCSVTVYTYSGDSYTKPVRGMVCSTSKTAKTLKNDRESYLYYEVGDKAEWVHLNDSKYYRYATYLGDNLMFQSTPYSDEKASALIADEYNKLGTASTANNIMLSVADAKWIYDNCNEGTLVRIVNDDNKSTFTPLGVPKGMKLTENSKSLKYDPTDKSEGNPYNKLKPVISGASDTVIRLGTGIDLLQGVSAVDTCGNDMTDKMTVDGNVNVNVEGKYIVSYYVSDGLGRAARVDRAVVVTEDENLLTTAPQTE